MKSEEDQSNLQDVHDVLEKLDGLTRSQWKFVLVLGVLQLYNPVHMMHYAFVGKDIPFTCYENFENSSVTLNSSCSICPNKTFLPNESSIVSEWDLTCERKWLSPATMSLFMLGAAIGAPVLGRVSDSQGRKFILFLTVLFMIGANVLGAVVSRFEMYCVSRVISGFFCGGYVLAIYVLTNELVSNKERGMATMVSSNGRSIGMVLLAIFAYLIPHWRFFTMMSSLMGIPILWMIFILPESPVWLQSKGRTEDATKSLEAILNGSRLNFILQNMTEEEDGVECGGICDLYSACSTLIMTFSVIYCWSVNHVVYYGLFLAAGIESDNIYISEALSGIVEIPSNIIGPLLLPYFGRRASFCGLLMMSGLSLFVIPIFDPMAPILIMLIANLGFFCVAASIDVGHIHTNEIFPTYIRNTGMGIAGMSSRFGGIVAPYIAKLGDIHPNLHFIVFGFLAVSAGIAGLNLPETRGQKLPETMADLLNMLKKQHTSKKEKSEDSHLLAEE